jgi:crossover junction endodeoxyribonuclease RusA
VKVTLPWPDKGLFPNRKNGRHWGAVSGLKTVATHEAWALAKAAQKGAQAPREGEVAVTLTFHFPDGRKRDADNLLAAMKPYIDGVSLALDIDDSRFWPITLNRVMDGAGKVEVQLW